MAEQIAIKQIKIGENNHDIDAKYWGGVESSYINDLATKSYVDTKVFVGTMAEYETAYIDGNIAVGALVVILDDSISGDSETTASLGTAVLGKMVLGQQ